MRRGKLVTKAKKITAIFLATAMAVGMLPLQGITAKAADDSPYVISTGRMVYASSSVSNSDPAYAVDGSQGTRWSSNFSDDAWMSVDLGKTYSVNKVVLNWEGAYGKAYKIQVSTDGNN